MPHCSTGDLEPVRGGERLEELYMGPPHAHKGLAGELPGEVVLDVYFKVPLPAQGTFFCFGEEDRLHKVAAHGEGKKGRRRREGRGGEGRGGEERREESNENDSTSCSPHGTGVPYLPT